MLPKWLRFGANVSAETPQTSAQSPQSIEENDAKYESQLLALLQEVEQGATAGNIQGFLIAKSLNPDRLAQWLWRKQAAWIAQPEQHRVLGRNLWQLSRLTKGALAAAAAEIGQQLAGELNQTEDHLVDPTIPSIQPNANEALSNHSPYPHPESVINQDNSAEQPSSELQDQADDWFEQGEQKYTAGDFHGAIESFNQALKYKPDFHRAWNGKGCALSELGRYEEAIESYNQALHYKPNNHAIWKSKGNALFDLERYEEAIESYNQALYYKPDYHNAWNDKGNALYHLRQHKKAIESYNQALHYKPNYHLAWNNKGSALAGLGWYEEAIESYNQALHYKPNYYNAWSNRGVTLYDLGRYEESIKSYEQALYYKPDGHHIWNSKGNSLYAVRRYEEALSSYEQAIQLDPNYCYAWNGRGNVLGDLKRYEEALSSYDKAIELKANDPLPWNGHGNVLKDLRRYEEALSSYDKAIELNASDPLPWNGRGNVLRDLKRYEEALSSYDRAIELNADDPLPWNGRGNALKDLGRYEEALYSYEKAIQLNADDPLPWHGRGLAVLKAKGHKPPVELLSWDSIIQKFDYLNLKRYIYQVRSSNSSQIFKCSPLPTTIQSPELEKRGYEGQIASLQIGLQHMQEGSEGEGYLHRELGHIHYNRGRLAESPNPHWRKAFSSYNAALKSLTIDRFPQLRLEVLQALIRVLYELNDTAAVQTLRREGRDLLRRLMTDIPASAQRLSTQFAGFNQISVDLAVQAGELAEAIKLAEDSKNTCLRWMLGLPEPPDFSIDQIHQQLPSQTAILYWHLSPCALTTFLLLPGQPEPIAILPPQPDIPNQRPATLKQLIDWENWLSDWNHDYQDYSPKKDQVNFASEQRHKPWRTQMADRLATLRQILQIDTIQEHLRLHEINQLILVPHRDLHRFPLHIYFDCPCTYLPSLYFGLDRNLNLSDQTIEPLEQLLLIENPKSDQVVPLSGVFMEIESALLQTELPAQVIANREADAETMLAAIQQPHPILHFSGHAEYNSQNPARSRLCLAGMDELTLKTLSGLDLSHYQLVCLAACETGVTGNQTITEEYVGLVSAFLAVGADRVVSTLWTVEAAASAYLIVEFYRQLRTGVSVSQALYHAQNQLKTADRTTLDQWLSEAISALPSRALRKPLQQAQQSIASSDLEFPYADPYYWAPFFVSGL